MKWIPEAAGGLKPHGKKIPILPERQPKRIRLNAVCFSTYVKIRAASSASSLTPLSLPDGWKITVTTQPNGGKRCECRCLYLRSIVRNLHCRLTSPLRMSPARQKEKLMVLQKFCSTFFNMLPSSQTDHLSNLPGQPILVELDKVLQAIKRRISPTDCLIRTVRNPTTREVSSHRHL